MTTVTSQATDRLTSRRRTLHTRGLQVFTAFLVSCVLLLVMSWIVVFDPRLALTAAPLKVLRHMASQSKTISTRNSPCAPWRWLIRSSPCCARKEFCRRRASVRSSRASSSTFRDRAADGTRDDADHAGCICTAPEMANHRDPTMRDDCIRGAGLGNIASVALEGGNRSILLRKADIGDGRRHVSFVPGANLLPVIWT
jgi:hypothetical protein